MHYWATGFLALALLYLLASFHLPMHYDWNFFLPTYWLVLPVQSAFLAILLFLLGSSWRDTLYPFIDRLRKNPARVLLVLVYTGILVFWTSWIRVIALTSTTIVFLELFAKNQAQQKWRLFWAVFLPALYLFVGLLLIFSYNDIIIRTHFFGKSDIFFNSIDAWLMHGATIASISHAATAILSMPVLRSLEFIYYSLFALIGAGIFLIGINFGRAAGLRYIGALLTAYYVSLTLFYLWPSQGPYYLSMNSSLALPAALRTHTIQTLLLARSQAIWAQEPLQKISGDYYIAFPCMHIAQSLIATWFLRSWRKMLAILVAYNALLLIAIILLQWHYIVDILAGILLAILSVAVVDRTEFLKVIRPYAKHKT